MIDEQMKAPLPPPPARRARRGTRASQGGALGQTEGSRPQESEAPQEAPSPSDQTREVETSSSRGIEPEESKEAGSAQADPKQVEPQQEPSSPGQASAEEKAPSQDEPQEQVAESVGLNESPSDKPASHEEQSQLQETAPEGQPVSGADRGIPEAGAEDSASAPKNATEEDEDSRSRAVEQATAPVAEFSEKSEHAGEATAEATADSANGDVGDSVHKNSVQDEPVTEHSNAKERELESGDAQKHRQSGDGDPSTVTPFHSQDQASAEEIKGVNSNNSENAGQSTDLPAADNDQDVSATRESPGSPENLTASEAHDTDKPAHEEEPDQSPSQPTNDDHTTSDSQREQEKPHTSENEDLFHGVAKGGAAEEYVKMAEAESGQEPQLGGDASSMPEQNSLSGSGHSGEQQDESSSRGVEEPEPAQLGSSTTEQGHPKPASHAQADERPSSASGPADPVDKARSPVESDHGSGQLQSRDIGSLDHSGSHEEPTVNPEQQLQSSSAQSEFGQSQDPDSSLTAESKDEKPSASFQESPDVDSQNDQQLQEPRLGDHSQSGSTSAESDFEPKNLDPDRTPASEVNKASVDEASVPEQEAIGTRSVEGQQEPHGNDQHDLSRESIHDEQEQTRRDAASQLEPDLAREQAPYSSDPSGPEISSRDAQLEKDSGDDQETGSFGGHQQIMESHDAPESSLDDNVSGDRETPQQSSHDAPSIVEPGKVDPLPHESGNEQEVGDKRSDSGYETGMASSRNLEDSTTTLHEDQHEHESVHGTESSIPNAPSQSEQEKIREPRPEQILEGSGKDVSPPRLGGEHQGSDDHPVEETFDLSGSEPIPGTMTHGKDETEEQGRDLGDGDVSMRDVSREQPADDTAGGAAAGDTQMGGVDETREKQVSEDPLPHESSQDIDQDYTHPGAQPMARDADDNIPADSQSQVAGEQLHQGDSQSVGEPLSQGLPGEPESSSKLSTFAEPQDQWSTSNDGQAEQSHPVEDVKPTDSHGLPLKHDATSVPASQEQEPEPRQLSQSPTAHDLSSDGFGSWSSQAFSRPANDNEFSFKKRADSVQVGRSHGPADRGTDLPFISTDGPNEDADEGLFAVPPTPRHEVDQDKPSQLQGHGESKPSSRASSRNGSTGADTLSPQAAEGIQSSHREENDRGLSQDSAGTKEDMPHEDTDGPEDGRQSRPDAFDTSDSREGKSDMVESGSEEPSNREKPDRGQPQEPLVTETESMPRGPSTGNDDEQQGHKNSSKASTSPEEQSITSEKHLDDSDQPETSPLEQHTDDIPSKSGINETHIGETQVGSDMQSHDAIGGHDAEPSGLSQGHDSREEGSSLSSGGDRALESSNDNSPQEGAQEDFSPREINTQPNSEQVQRDGGESDNRSLGENSQAQHGEVSESQPLEGRPFSSVSNEDGEPAGSHDMDKQTADSLQSEQDGTQHPEPGRELEGDLLEHSQADVDHTAHQPSPDYSSQHLGAQQQSYDGEGYGVTPTSEYSSDPLADPAPREKNETHPVDDYIETIQPETHSYDAPDSALHARNDDTMDSDSETFETPLESAGLGQAQQDGRSATPGHFTRALDHLPDESAHTVQGTDDLFDDTDDNEDQDDFGEAVVYQHSDEASESSPSAEKTVYSTRGDENNTALGGHRSSLSLGSVGHRSQGSISSIRDTTPVRPTFGSYIGGPSIVRADWAAEHEEELRPSSRNPTPQLGPSTTHDTPEISPFALRNTPLPSHGSDQRGLSSSMWNPERPQTPTSTTAHSNNPFATPQRQAEPEIDPSLFVPRDVTHGRQDSVPASLHSQTTLDSSWSSPVHSSLPVDRHEPVIRDSWPAPAPGYQQYLSGWSSRPRGDTTSTAAEYDPFRPDNGGAPGGHSPAKPSSSYNPFLQRGRAESSVSAAPSNPSVSNSPSRGSALFAKMRNIFENQGSNGANDAPASPGKTRPVSGVFHPAVSAPRKSQDSFTGQRDDERGGFLNEADHEIDERSAFLRSDGQPSGHMAYNDEH